MGTNQKSIFQITITGSSELTPEVFLQNFDPTLLEKIGLQLTSFNSKTLSVNVLDYEINEIDDL